MRNMKLVTGINTGKAIGRPSILAGDSIYYKHPEHGGPHHGVVAGIGKDGMLVDSDGGGEHQVMWNGYIAHRARAERKLTIVDRGEDGSIMEDESGKRVFVRGKIEDYDLGARDDAETLEKALISVPAVPVTPENHPLNETLRTMSNLLDAVIRAQAAMATDVVAAIAQLKDSQAAQFQGLCAAIAMMSEKQGDISAAQQSLIMEDMHKALHDDDHDIWLPHESEFIRDLIEKWTAHGMGRFGLLQNELGKWINHAYHQPGIKSPTKPGAFVRWDKSELAMARFYLESVPPEAFALDDWMMVVDYLVQRYLPQDAIFDEAKWNVTRASMMGRMQGQMPDMAAAVAAMASKLPDTVAQIEKQFGMTATQKASIKFSQARTCQYVTNIEDATRAKMKMAIVDWQKDKFEGAPSAMAKRSLEGKLLDEFAILNKDWRRIALTEAGEAANQGMVSATPTGQKLKRVEQYRGACAYCRKIDGAVVTVVDSSKADKNWNTEIWPGKDNHARSASPYKRVGGQLVKRDESERWSIPAGLAHPHCRGRWLNLTPTNPKDDPKMSAWLEKVFDKK